MSSYVFLLFRYVLLGYNIAKAPLYYVRSGFFAINSGYLRVFGAGGYYLSSRASSDAINAYYFVFVTNAVHPSYYDYNGYRYVGFPLRCLAD